MGTPKGDDKARGEQLRPQSDSARPGAYVQTSERGGRGRRRRQAEARTETAKASAGRDVQTVASVEAGFASGLIDTVAETHGSMVPGDSSDSANSNHRMDIVPVAAAAEPAPEEVARGSQVSPESETAASNVDSASVLDAPFSMHQSVPPVAKPSWAMRAWVFLMCAIIGAAGLVALRDQRKQNTPPTRDPDGAVAKVEVPAQAAVVAKAALPPEAEVHAAAAPAEPVAQPAPEPATEAESVPPADESARPGNSTESAPKRAMPVEASAHAVPAQARPVASGVVAAVIERKAEPEEVVARPSAKASAARAEPAEPPAVPSEPAVQDSVPDNPYGDSDGEGAP
jgi:hypothetical protein